MMVIRWIYIKIDVFLNSLLLEQMYSTVPVTL